MTAQIVRREVIEEMAREAFYAGRSRDSHEMNWHAAALPAWLEEFDRLASEHTSPPSHIAPAGRQRVDHRQGGAA